MASGLMTLAYIGEIAVVFNLAYLELHRDRYIHDAQQQIQKLREKIQDAVRGRTSPVKELDKMDDQLASLTSDKKRDRRVSWHLRNGEDDVQQRRFLAGPVYSMFMTMADRQASQNALILGSVLLVLLPILDYFHVDKKDLSGISCLVLYTFLAAIATWVLNAPWKFKRVTVPMALAFLGIVLLVFSYSPVQQMLDHRYSAANTWWVVFSLFLLSVCVPVVCIICGRMVKATLDAIRSDIRKQFDEYMVMSTKSQVNQLQASIEGSP